MLKDLVAQIKAVLTNKVGMGIVLMLVYMGTIAPKLNDMLILGLVVAVAALFNAKLDTKRVLKQDNLVEGAGNVVAFAVIFAGIQFLQSFQVGAILTTDGVLSLLKIGLAVTAISETYGFAIGKVIR